VDSNRSVSSVARQGAGLLNVEHAILGTTRIAPSRLALNDTADNDTNHNHPITRTITITNYGRTARTYQLSHTGAVSVKGMDPDGVALPIPETSDISASVEFQPECIDIPAGGSHSVRVHITPPDFPSAGHWVYSGYIVCKPTPNPGDSERLIEADTVHVPYLGMKGRFHDINVMLNDYVLPHLKNRRTNRIIRWPDETDTYTIVDGDYPAVAMRLEFPTRRFQTRIYEADTHKLVGQIPGSFKEGIGRNDEIANMLIIFHWKGDVTTLGMQGAQQTTRDLENGRYYIELMALRPFGDIDNDDDYDTWRSPTITIRRPENPMATVPRS